MNKKFMAAPALAKRLGFIALVIYGVGDILGAGIYALVGKVIGIAGSGAWLTFILSAVIAIFTGFSYAELTARFPVAAGAAAFVKRAFPGHLMATVAGVFVLSTGLSSAATVSTAFSGYLNQIFEVPPFVAQVGLVTVMSLLSFWGIEESSRINMLFTAAEFSGLVAVIVTGILITDISAVKNFWHETTTNSAPLPVLSGITVAFFAYIGFEDLCNLAEEAKNPTKDLPRAILVAIGVSTLIYLLVILLVQINIPSQMIATSATPLLLVFEKGKALWFLDSFAFIAMMAIANTGLINLIMASRLMYGMANENLLPATLSRVHAKTQTPWIAILIAYLLVILLISTGGTKILAQTTSLLVISVFMLVHLSLIRIKWRTPETTGIRVPLLIPILGFLFCLTLIGFYPLAVFLRTGLILILGLAIWQFNSRPCPDPVGL